MKTITFTKHQLFINQAPCWNFELDEDQLLVKALEVGFVTKIGKDQYKMNNNYRR
jgi:hypothetical protein|tara:strand:+ start:206 stop:370 length:165 start_codon:yes stop_codon:yes gene_type:complete